MTMSHMLDAPQGLEAEEFEAYRALSKGAVLALVMGLLSLTVVLTPLLLCLPLVGIASGVIAWRRIRRYPHELTGRAPAAIGVLLSAVLLVVGVGMHGWIYATEVPEGYQRIAYDDLQPVPEASRLPFSPAALELNGQRVFIKGYVYPDGQQANIKRFVLVADLGTCCFGGQPKLTHMVEVTLRDPHRVEYSFRKRGLGGILHVDRHLKPLSGLGGVYFQLDADYVR